MPYPPGVSSGTRNAPWNEKPAPTCPDCTETIVEVEDHDDGCPISKADPEELHRINEELAQPSYEPGGL